MHKLGELTFDPVLPNGSNHQQMENFIFPGHFIVFTQCQIRAGGILEMYYSISSLCSMQKCFVGIKKTT